MKRFLTVLLVIAVMFTFSFGTSFAATEYSLDDYKTALTAEKTNQVGYLQNAKTQAVNAYTYDKDGYVEIGGVKYTKAAIEAAADKVIADLTKAMDAAINTELNGTFPTTTAPNKAVVTAVTAGYLTAAGMQGALEAETKTLNETQAPITKAAVEAYIAKVNVNDYASDNAETSGYAIEGIKVSSAEYVQNAINAAKKTIADAKDKTAEEQLAAYNSAKTTLEATVGTVLTKEDDAINSGAAVKTVDQAINAYIADATATAIFTDVVSNKAAYEAGNVDATAIAAAQAGFYTAKTTSKKATLYGVEIADITKITRAEAVAVNDAAYATITGIKSTMKAYAGEDVAKITALTGSKAEIYNFTQAATVYDKVKAEGEKMKAEKQYGVKVYDDAAVEKAVVAAEKLVMADIAGEFKTPAAYINAAATAEKLNLANKDFNADKFAAEQKAAIDKFIAAPVTVGSNPTAEADKVYAKSLYADVDKYEKIKADAIKAINAAQSSADIEKAMADAKAELGKLMLAADAADVAAAQTAYKNSLEAYKTQVEALSDKDAIKGTQYANALEAGKKLIDKATTVDGVKAAYAEAQKIIDSVKTDKELEAAAKAVNDAVNALPYDSTITAADEAAVQAAYDAYKAYAETPGADLAAVAGAKATLAAKLDAVYEAKVKDLEAEAKAVKEAYEAAPNGDAGVAVKAELAEKTQAIVDALDAIEDALDAIEEDELVNVPSIGADTTNIQAVAEKDGINDACQDAIVDDAYIKMMIAKKDGATQEEINAAADAYNKLTDKQKYELEKDGITIDLVKDVLAKADGGAFDDEAAKAYLQDLKIVARSAKVGSKIKVTIKADVQTLVDNGYTVEYKFFKSTKKRAGYKSQMTKTTKTYTTSKGTKGTTYFFKATLTVKNAAGEVVAKTPLTQCKYAQRTK